jgi:hypothetical protein
MRDSIPKTDILEMQSALGATRTFVSSLWIKAIVEFVRVVRLIQRGLTPALAAAQWVFKRIDGNDLTAVRAEAGEVRLAYDHTAAGTDRLRPVSTRACCLE